MSSLTERLLAKSTIKSTSTLDKSTILTDVDEVPTAVPLINVALSGRTKGGLRGGLGVMAGPSKHFKTGFTLLMVGAYLKKHKDAICLFYDSEFGAPQSYFKSHGIDPSRVVHTPISNIEELKFDIMKQLEEIKRTDKVIIICDSVGNLASKKEVEDAMNEKSVADMTRAKALKGLFRMVTPYLTTKDIPMIVINHTYQTQEMFSKTVVSGGTGIYYSANWIMIIGRAQEKDKDDELSGYKFTINIEKSRYVIEKSKLPIVVSFDSGIDRWSGFHDLALELGFMESPKKGWYTRTNVVDDKMWRAKEMGDEFWTQLMADGKFEEAITKNFVLPEGQMVRDEDYAEDVDDDGVIKNADELGYNNTLKAAE